MTENLRENFVNKFSAAREQTLRLFEFADESVLRRSPGFGFRPILWHLAHLGTFEEYWLLNKIGGADPINKRFQRIFDPIKTPRENSTDLPTKTEMLGYLKTVRENVWRVLENFDFAAPDPLYRNGYVFDLVHQHELQHQETLAYLLHLLPLEKLQTSNFKLQIPIEEQSAQEDNGQRTIEIAEGETQIGSSFDDFAYDNEKPARQMFIPAFKLDRCLTTNSEFAEFIAKRGYERREFWSEEGWQFQQKENLKAPLYWGKNESSWQIRQMFAVESLADLANFPVYGISFYEAEAYARFREKRLPTELEWEKAALLGGAPQFENINYGWRFGETRSAVHSKNEIFADLLGNLWEWTSSDFAPYPNFQAFPYEDYSETWFDGDHKVLKGGSFATSREILRPSFRNFFRRPFRLAFAGIRLAANV